jgi:transposase
LQWPWAHSGRAAPIADVARNIGVHEMTLRRWVNQIRDAAESGTAPDAPLGESERLELIRLRSESKDDKSTITELQMQVEFAKKVATWFAKGKQ